MQAIQHDNTSDWAPGPGGVPDGLTVLLHIYYPGSWLMIYSKCKYALDKAARIIVTVCDDDVRNEIPVSDKVTVLTVPNKGKDVGGKLISLAYYITHCNKTAYLALLHDKISPQTINADYWLEKLYSIYQEPSFQKIIALFNSNKKIGVIGAKTFVKNEFIRSTSSFGTTNNDILKTLLNKYQLHCQHYDFIAGTIFIARSAVFEKFFLRFSALEAREKLETGNVLDLEQGTYTHAWERLFCLIADDQGYKIKGI